MLRPSQTGWTPLLRLHRKSWSHHPAITPISRSDPGSQANPRATRQDYISVYFTKMSLRVYNHSLCAAEQRSEPRSLVLGLAMGIASSQEQAEKEAGEKKLSSSFLFFFHLWQERGGWVTPDITTGSIRSFCYEANPSLHAAYWNKKLISTHLKEKGKRANDYDEFSLGKVYRDGFSFLLQWIIQKHGNVTVGKSNTSGMSTINGQKRLKSLGKLFEN